MPSARAALKKAFNSFTRENNVNQIFQTGKQQPQKKIQTPERIRELLHRET
jgi:hypothetical protein